MSEDIHKWSDGRYTLMFDEHTFFVWDNEKDKRMTALQVTKRLNEQQDTIFKLQDLCGESDGENARLRIQNKNLKETNRQLREINKEIGDDLYNCRLNKNITAEKLKLWQDTLAEYDIYTIEDLCESVELDAKISKEKDDL